MKMTDYQKLSARTINPEQSHRENLANFGLGLWEAGETADLIKKHLYHGHELDRGEVAKELGDLLWYIAGIATALDLDLGDIAQGNIDKLRKRFPNGFSEADSIARVDVD